MAISEETFFLNPKFEGTLQAQIQQMVAQGILSGRFRPGERMPSSRKLAAHLGVSRLTVTLSYNELMADDYLTSAGRSGYFVSHNAPPPPERPGVRQGRDTVDWTRRTGKRFSGAPQIEKPADWSSFRYPFVYGQADPALFDHQNWRLCALQALGRKDFTALTADHAGRDDPQLVEFVARNTLPRRGILAAPSEILITAGAQNALWLAAQVLLGRGGTAVHEDPCYPGLRDILRHLPCTSVPVPVDDRGLPPDQLLDRAPGGADVVFTTPSHQCPTTATMPLDRRRALLDMARRRDFLVVEDDYEFEMSFLRPTAPALKSLDEDGRVIYVGSFSKSLFPGLRLGYLVGSAEFIAEARALRSTVLRHIPGHVQRTVAYFLSRGHYDALIRRIRLAYHDRSQVMDRAVRANGLKVSAQAAFGGSSFWMRTPAGQSAALLAQRLRPRSVLIEPGRPFFGDAAPSAPGRGDDYFRLAYSSIPAERIPDGIAQIAEALRDL